MKRKVPARSGVRGETVVGAGIGCFTLLWVLFAFFWVTVIIWAVINLVPALVHFLNAH